MKLLAKNGAYAALYKRNLNSRKKCGVGIHFLLRISLALFSANYDTMTQRT